MSNNKYILLTILIVDYPPDEAGDNSADAVFNFVYIQAKKSQM